MKYDDRVSQSQCQSSITEAGEEIEAAAAAAAKAKVKWDLRSYLDQHLHLDTTYLAIRNLLDGKVPLSTSCHTTYMLRTVEVLILAKHLCFRPRITNCFLSVDQLIQIDKSRSQFFVKCVDCLLYLTIVFPNGYEADDRTLVQLWMAEGFIEQEPMEKIGASYLEALVSSGCVSFLRENHTTGKLFYMVNDLIFSRQLLSRKHNLFSSRESTYLVHLRSPLSHIKQLPYHHFIKSSFSRLVSVLSLSESRIKEIPTSIANLKSLRYLDLSKTLINQLPQNIDRLPLLQTLKLHSCPHLVSLPKRIVRMTSLRHLDLGTTSNLHSMPPGMGALTGLRTLSLFLVGSEELGSSLAQLKDLHYLMGKICLSRLQNVTNLEELREVNLSCILSDITKLELRWNPRQQAKITIHNELLENFLQSDYMLEDLRIIHYGGSKFPKCMSGPSLKHLSGITLFECENCSSLPSLGQLPELKFLEITGFPKVRTIDIHFYRDNRSGSDIEKFWFPNLLKLSFTSMLNLEEWEDVTEFHFPNLHELKMKDCPKLTTLCRLSNIELLKRLEISACPLIPSLPEGRLPSLVEKLAIEDCLLLKSSCSYPDGQDWYKIEHVPLVLVDYENIALEK